jgi:ankyrin repeat protein
MYTAVTFSKHFYDANAFRPPEIAGPSGSQTALHYSREKHGELAQFARHPDYAQFKREYEALLDGIVDFAQTQGRQMRPPLSDAMLAEIVSAFDTLKANIFTIGIDDQLGKKSFILVEGRASFEELARLLQSPIALQKRVETVKALAGRVTVCVGGVLTELQDAVSSLKCHATGSKGVAHRVKIQMLEALINEHIREIAPADVHSIHRVNAYFNALAPGLGIAPRNDPYVHSRPKRKDLERCNEKVVCRMVPMAMAKNMAEQYMGVVKSAAAAEGVEDVSAAIAGDKIAEVNQAISELKIAELDGQFGEVPANLYLSEVEPPPDEPPSAPQYRVAATTVPMEAHFLSELKAQGLVNYDDTLVLSAQTPDGGQLHMLGQLFWVSSPRGEYREADLNDFLSADPSTLAHTLASQGLDKDGRHQLVNQVVDQLVSLARPGTAQAAPSLALVAALSRVYEQSAPRDPKALHPALHLGMVYDACIPAVKRFVALGGDLSGADDRGFTSPMLAAEKGSSEMLKLLLPQASSIRGMAAFKLARRALRKTDPIKAAAPGGRTLLMLAAQHGHTDAVNTLLELRAQIDAADHHGDTALMLAAAQGHIATVNALVAAQANLDARNKRQQTPLMVAASMGQTEAVKTLCAQGADINALDVSQASALTRAAFDGDHLMVSTLIGAGADIDFKNRYGETPLSLSAKHGHILTMRALLDAGADPELVNLHGQTPLMVAVEEGRIEAVQVLCEKEVNLEARDATPAGHTALLWAVVNGRTAMVQTLVDAGANLDAKSEKGETLLMVAARTADYAMVQALVGAGANLKATNNHGETPLMLAIRVGHTEVVQFLFAQGGDVNLKTRDDALVLAVEKGNAALVQTLLDAGADLKAINEFGQRPLIVALIRGHAEVAQALLAKGADIDARDTYGNTALMRAAFMDDHKLLRRLVSEGADLNAQNHAGQTALISATAYGGFGRAVEILIELGADSCRIKDASGNTALSHAERSGFTKLANIFRATQPQAPAPSPEPAAPVAPPTAEPMPVVTGANAEAQNQLGQTALIVAASAGELDAVNTLIEDGAKLNAQDLQGNTALILAAERGELEVVRALVAARADLDILSKTGTTAFQRAIIRGHTEIVAVLQEARFRQAEED